MRKKQLWLAVCMMTVCMMTILMLIACTGNVNAGNETERSTATAEIESETLPYTEAESESETMRDIVPVTEPETTEAETRTRIMIAGVNISEFSIVVPTNMPSGQHRAVDDFIYWIAEATGYTLPKITGDQHAEHEIVLGRTALRPNAALTAAVSKIENDGYAMRVDDGTLYISASTGRGIAYGIYDFLENYAGVRFYSRDFTHVRHAGLVSLDEGMEKVFSPAFEARWLWAQNIVSNRDWYFLQSKNNTHIAQWKLGDTITIYTNSNHTFPLLLGEEYEGGLPCLTDETVYQKVKTSVMASLANNSNLNAIQVGQADARGYCTCANCQAVIDAHGGTPMATFLQFLNRLGDEVGRSYPHVKVIAYAYFDTHEPPTNMTVSDHVIIDFCLDNACYQHALNDPDCEKNVLVATEFKKWAELCRAGNLYVYDYAWNCGVGILPDPNLFVMWNNFQFYRECGVTGILSEGIPSNGGDLDHLRYYLRSKLCWNPDMTEEEFYTLMDEFMEDYYGDAAPYMKQYIEKLYDPARMKKCTQWFTPYERFYANTIHVEKMYKYFADALSLETLSEAERDHVQYSSMHLIWHLKDHVEDATERAAYTRKWRQYVKWYGLPHGTTQ